MASDEYRPPWLPVNPVPEPDETTDKAPEAEPESAAAPAPDEPDEVPAPTTAPPARAESRAPEETTAPAGSAAPAEPVAPAGPEGSDPLGWLDATPRHAEADADTSASLAPEASPFAPPASTGGSQPEAADASAPFAPPAPSALAPEPEPITAPRGSTPSTAAAAAFFSAHRDASTPREVEPDAPDTPEQPEAVPFAPSIPPTPPTPPAPSTPPMSPYLSGTRPGAFAPAPPHEPEPQSKAPFSSTPEPEPSPEPEPEPSPGPDPQPSPEPQGVAAPEAPAGPASSAAPESPATPEDSWSLGSPPSEPVTGSVPAVRPDDLTPTKPAMPYLARPIEPESPAGVPSAPDSDEVPTPIEADDDEIIAPILPPPASEIMPRAGDHAPERRSSGAGSWEAPSASERPASSEFSPAPTDSVRQLGESAISNASLQAAGAPTPLSGIPRVDDQDEPFPSFGDDQPFVPRFEPSPRSRADDQATPQAPAQDEPSAPHESPAPSVVPPQPAVSFAEPSPKPTSPLSELNVPETDGPAYTPRVELSSRPSDEPSPSRLHAHPDQGEAAAPPHRTPAPPEDAPEASSRPWSAVRDDDVEFGAPSLHPGTPLPSAVPEESAPTPPASTPHAPERSAPFASPAAPGETPSPTSFEPAEPRLPMPPRRNAPADEVGASAEKAADGNDADQEDVTPVVPRKRRRWVWWLIPALLVAAAVGVLIYRMFLLPEPITLPIPTVTAEPASPLGQPISIEDPTDFLAVLPDTVETYVLMDTSTIDTAREPDLPARVAEHDVLRYGVGVSAPLYVVDAYQHYTVDDAQVSYDAFADGATDVAPVLVDDEQVGDRAFSTEGDKGTVVWRNATAVFVLTGPADSVLDFYEHFGV